MEMVSRSVRVYVFVVQAVALCSHNGVEQTAANCIDLKVLHETCHDAKFSVF